MKHHPLLGVLGGLGPMSTVYFCNLLIEHTKAMGDSDHIDMLISDGETRENVVRRVRRIDALYRLVPFILDPRRIVTLCDHAAGHPEWWQVNRLHFFMPELTLRQLADITGLENFQVREALKNVEITDDCYKKLPKMEETKWI